MTADRQFIMQLGQLDGEKYDEFHLAVEDLGGVVVLTTVVEGPDGETAELNERNLDRCDIVVLCDGWASSTVDRRLAGRALDMGKQLFRYEPWSEAGPLRACIHQVAKLLADDQPHVVVNEQTGGVKGVKPEQYSMIPVAFLAEVARVYADGAEKYDRNNWRKGYAWSLSYDALQRHVNAFWGGEMFDESGHHHLAHAAFHLATLYTFSTDDIYEELDDR